MAEVIEVPGFKQAFKEFFEIGNWTLGTFSIFMASSITSFFLVRLHADVHGSHSVSFILILVAILVLFTFAHYRITTLHLRHYNTILFIALLMSAEASYLVAAFASRIL